MNPATRYLPMLVLLAVVLTATACDRLFPSAPDELDPVSDFDEVLNASDIWQRYQSSSTSKYANDEFKNLWANILLDGIRRNDEGEPAGIDAVAGTRLIIRAPGKINTLEFHFRFREDTEDYERGQKPTVLCNIKGTDVTRTKIEFVHCRGESATPPTTGSDPGTSPRRQNPGPGTQ